jgi:hypothetical protein
MHQIESVRFGLKFRLECTHLLLADRRQWKYAKRKDFTVGYSRSTDKEVNYPKTIELQASQKSGICVRKYSSPNLIDP